MEEDVEENASQTAEVVAPANVDMAPLDEQGDTVMEDPQPQDEEEAKASDDAPIPSSVNEADVDPVVTKKRKAGEALGEILDMADSLKVCPISWVHHPDTVCPREKEGEALIKTFLRMQGGGKPLGEDTPAECEGSYDVVMDSEDASQAHADAAPKADQSPSTVCPGVIPRQKARPTPEVQGPKQTFVPASSSDLPNFGGGDVAPPQTKSRTRRTSRTRCLSSLNTLSQDLPMTPTSSRRREQSFGSKGYPQLQRNEDTDRIFLSMGAPANIYRRERHLTSPLAS